jgi:hypothetical protein
MRFVLWFTLGTAGLSWCGAGTMICDFSVNGYLEYTAFSNGSVQRHENYLFSVIAHENGWTISTSLNDSLKIAERSYDAVKNTSYTKYTQQRGELATNISVGYISPGEWPKIDGSRMEILWLAYLSGSYFKSRTSAYVVPVWMLSNDQLVYSNDCVKAVWSLEDTAPYCPSSVRYYNRMISEKDGDGPLKTVAEFNCIDTVLVGNMRIPREFRFVQYATGPSDGTPVVRALTHGIVLSHQYGPIERNALPTYETPMQIVDLRFATSSNDIVLDYTRTNGNWPDMGSLTNEYRKTTNEIGRLQAFHRQRQSDRERSRNIQAVFILAVIIASANIIVIMVRKRGSPGS